MTTAAHITPSVDASLHATRTALLESERFLRSTLDALSAHIAILDEQGTIIEVNAAWNSFAGENNFKGKLYGLGDSYLNICASASGSFSEEAAPVGNGIRAVMAGQRNEFHLEYPCHGPLETRWFVVRATRFAGDGPVRVVVAHANVTERKLAEMALIESERRLAHAMSLAQLAAWDFEVASGLFTFSDRYYALHGTTAEREGGHVMSAAAFVSNFMHPGDAHLVAAEVAKAMATADPDYRSLLEARIFRRGGELRHVAVHIAITKDAAGRTTHLRGANQDITERKKSEQALRNLGRAVEQAPATVVITDFSGRIEYVNPRFVETTGYSVAEALGLNPRVLKSGLHDASFYRAMWGTLLQGKVWQGEISNKKKNGDLYWESASISPVRDDHGNVTHFVAVKEDITERKRVVGLLRQSEERYRSLVDNARDVIFTLAADGTFTSLNPAVGAIAGVSQDEWVGKSFEPMVHPGDRSLARDMLRHILQGGKEPVRELRLNPSVVRAAVLEITVAAQKDESGRIIGLQGIARDITERKHAAQQLAELTATAERSRRALEHEHVSRQSHFVAMVSHEFRTPLGVINTAAHLLGRYSDHMSAEDRAAQIEEIQGAVSRMTLMMEDLLIHGEFETGNAKCRPVRLDVEALCRQLLSDASKNSATPGLIECRIEPAAREAFVDGKILRHILSNLLSNAVKYSWGGQPVTLEVTRVAGNARIDADASTSAHDQLHLVVSDSGIGIPAADLAKLYGSFHRAANVGDRPGSGMGLAIVKQCVDLHRGAIRVDSTVGKGTSVQVWLPIVSPDEPGPIPKAS